MRSFCGGWVGGWWIFRCVWLVLMPMVSLHGQQPDQDQREQIGEVLGRPVFRDAIRTGSGVQLRDELHRLFTTPVLQQYRQQHKYEIEPTEDELVFATAYFDKKHLARSRDKDPGLHEQLRVVEGKLGRGGLSNEQQQQLEVERWTLQSRLDPPGRFFAMFILSHWKFQKHLYERYGGGRILWQQAGWEAFDAYRTWLEVQEKQGDFEITDPDLRSVFYEYWTTMNHGAFLTKTKAGILNGFPESEWMPKAPAKD